VLALLLVLFIPLIVQQANNLAGVDYQSIAQALREPMSQLTLWLESRGLIDQQISAEDQLQYSLRLQDWFKPAKIGDFFTFLLTAAGNVLIGLVLRAVYHLFLLARRDDVFRLPRGHHAQQYENNIRQAFLEIERLLTRYFGGLLIQISILTAFMWILLSLLGIENALLIAFFAALINLIPYVGPLIGAIFGVFITISANLDLNFYEQMLPLIIRVAASFAAMQMLDNYVLQPVIFSKSVKAHPLEIFIIILMGAKINGIMGMVLAIPVYTVLRVVAKTFLSELRVVQALTDSLK
jgi:predicted PurR-regulated permease PerM